ncbi:MAG: hypothetical protein PW844_06820 [Pantoea sp.]|uniref:hypothetical protein n=1 Tax=Pantoea sp. TaxID=69393 RepID=UPI00238C356C|nr:hypothetical protein [Pantoea sp.]MDE1186176.1 hypothetical protein [Pantoea sp.]
MLDLTVSGGYDFHHSPGGDQFNPYRNTVVVDDRDVRNLWPDMRGAGKIYVDGTYP